MMVVKGLCHLFGLLHYTLHLGCPLLRKVQAEGADFLTILRISAFRSRFRNGRVITNANSLYIVNLKLKHLGGR